ncbi:MAG: hypothetical protein QXX38_02745, partial [Candidatus Aenigmatarchaeota archaeon]
LIIAIIIGVVLLYIAWTRGWHQFLFPVDEATCKTQLLRACDKYENEGKNDPFKPISDQCGNFVGVNIKDCKENQENACENLCSAVRSKWGFS